MGKCTHRFIPALFQAFCFILVPNLSQHKRRNRDQEILIPVAQPLITATEMIPAYFSNMRTMLEVPAAMFNSISLTLLFLESSKKGLLLICHFLYFGSNKSIKRVL